MLVLIFWPERLFAEKSAGASYVLYFLINPGNKEICPLIKEGKRFRGVLFLTPTPFFANLFNF